MSEQDYLQADQEVLSMFSRENRSQNPTVGVIIPLNRVQAIDRDARYRRQVALILKASGRAGLGLVFVGAMSKAEILHTRIGEMFEMMDCHAIANGANPKRNVTQSFDDALKVR